MKGKHCQQCGTKLPKQALGGLCPRCVGQRLLAAELKAPSPSVSLEPPLAIDESVGLKLGRYKLAQKLGEGGCGVVYAAEQEEPIRRRVALKVIKLGMDTKSVVARFEVERQALAMMDQPNIAKVFDAGATASGRPYFVMELVSGTRITEYCDQNQLTLEARIELFVIVCQAVQHAHQKGIIHRDLKPSNILVTVQDGVPTPKVIDFGIAKATEQRLTEATLVTELNQCLGTPAYMSPEQAEMSGLDIDTRSDIYSLGVLLYELLTGTTLFDARDMIRAGPDATRRTIREVEPPRPSTRLSTLTAADLDTVARLRRTGARELRSELRGDLDWIVMKCLEKDRARRYETATGLAQDLRRHLADEPVAAGAPSAGYKFGKFARRNKVALAVAALVAVVLITATGISAWQAIRASQAESIAKQRLTESEKARQDAESISKFLIKVFQSPDPRRDGRTVTVAETLGNAAREIETDLAVDPRRRAKLQSAIGQTYHALGLYRDAIEIQEKVRDFYLASLGPRHSNTLQAVQALAWSHARAGHNEQALALRTESSETHRKAYGPGHLDTIRAMSALADSIRGAGRLEEEPPLRKKVFDLAQEALGPEHPDTLAALRALADAPAVPMLERARHWEELVAASRKVHGTEHRYTLDALGAFADIAAKVRLTTQAQAAFEESVALARKVLGPNHPETITWTTKLKGFYITEEKHAEAEIYFTEALVRARESGATNSLDLETCLLDMANFRRGQGQYANAEVLYLEFLEKCRGRAGGVGSVAEMNAITLLSDNLCEWAWGERESDAPAALKLAKRGESLSRQVVAPATRDPRFTEKRLASMQSRLGGAITAVACMDTNLTLSARESMLREAEALLIEGRTVLKNVRLDQPTNYKDSLLRLVRLYEQWNKASQAGEIKSMLDALRRERAPLAPSPLQSRN
ncbi:MAG: serine/threonine-protein kinase [Verrucomicrobiales bacterium]|nr:serine/threonine-protein kinase [Verrucomicrobiales bacterium]